MKGLARCRGQAAVELCALAPLLAVIGLGVTSALALADVAVGVEHALDAAVIASAAGNDAVAAARTALPPGLRPGASVRWEAGRLVVTVPRHDLTPGYTASTAVVR